ncbi:helix-turn-helix domain-containing protein [Rhodobacterales bacterium HKCCE2091]|nr:helix-turn-helix domain-containing protein [Rhodobacterales bacterium HKCCE2091]
MTAMDAGGTAGDVGIVVYPGAQLTAVHGLTDLFAIAGRFAGRAGAGAPPRVSHWQPDLDGEGFARVLGEGPVARPDILIVPPTMTDPPPLRVCQQVADWIRSAHAEGTLVVAICSGVYMLAHTGLLDGRVASTHHSYAAPIRESFPSVAIDLSRRVVDYPDLMTAGGFMAWVDIGLVLVGRLLGAAVRDQTARFILAAPSASVSGGGPAFVPPLGHGDAAVRRAQDLVHAHDGRGLALAQMALAAQLERRTFLRRFANATGMTPVDYCRSVRIARARELLESGDLALKEIADTLGYADVSSFARAFRRVEGVPPGSWRKRYGGAFAGGRPAA